MQKVEGSSPFSRFFPLVQAVSGGFEMGANLGKVSPMVGTEEPGVYRSGD